MKTSALRSIGLSEDQILTYSCLLENGTLSPPELAAITKESRTNAYMSLRKLEALGLAERDETAKKLSYKPVSPAHLEQLLIEQEQVIQANRAELQAQLPSMLKLYYSNVEQPAVQFYEGQDALELVYKDQIATGQDVHYVRSLADKKHITDALYDLMKSRAESSITTHGLVNRSPAAAAWAKKNDAQNRLETTWLEPGHYKAPVEISIYGNKVAFVAFGNDILATIIDSQVIAQAMREIFALAKTGAINAPPIEPTPVKAPAKVSVTASVSKASKTPKDAKTTKAPPAKAKPSSRRSR